MKTHVKLPFTKPMDVICIFLQDFLVSMVWVKHLVGPSSSHIPITFSFCNESFVIIAPVCLSIEPGADGSVRWSLLLLSRCWGCPRGRRLSVSQFFTQFNRSGQSLSVLYCAIKRWVNVAFDVCAYLLLYFTIYHLCTIIPC